MLTSAARETLADVETVIIDEIHALAATKRGSHLALTLERLEERCEKPPQRIGLSATQRPLDEIARFLGGQQDGAARPVTVVDAGIRKTMEIEVVVPVEDMGRLGEIIDEPVEGPAAAGPVRRSDLAVDAPDAPGADPRAQLDDRLRQRPPPGRAPGHPPQRAPPGGPVAGRPRRRAGRPRPATSW